MERKEFLTLFKVLRKASIFGKQGDFKRSRFYLGLVKREWNFLSDKAPDELRMKIESLIRKFDSLSAWENIEKLEADIRRMIMKYLERNMRLDALYKLRELLLSRISCLKRKPL